MRWAFLSVALLVSACEPAEIENSQSGLKYDPPTPFATTCDCTSTHGTCSADCSSIACDSGFGDCDGDLKTGCETALTTSPTNCGTCGNDCTACRTGASCVAGSCTGHQVTDGQKCSQAGCSSGTCASGTCMCGSGGGPGGNGTPDMSMKPPDGGHGCDFSGGGMATAWLLLLLGTVALLGRRRRA